MCGIMCAVCVRCVCGMCAVCAVCVRCVFGLCGEDLRGKFRSGIITEYSLDLLCVPETPQEEKKSTHPSNKKLNDLCTNQQRAIAFTWASGEEGYEEWLEVKRAKAQTEVEKAAEKKQQEDDKKEEAKIAKDRKEEKNRQEKAMRDCCATLSAPAPLPKDMDDDTYCRVHCVWRGMCTESGVRFPWNHCRKCETWWCPKCLTPTEFRIHTKWCSSTMIGGPLALEMEAKPQKKPKLLTVKAANDHWAACDACHKWRKLKVPWTGEKFYCWLTLTRKKKTSACEPHCDCEDPCDCPNNPTNLLELH